MSGASFVLVACLVFLCLWTNGCAILFDVSGADGNHRRLQLPVLGALRPRPLEVEGLFLFKNYDFVQLNIVTTPSKHLRVTFFAYNRTFDVMLQEDSSVFHPSVKVAVKSGSVPDMIINASTADVGQYFVARQFSNKSFWGHGHFLRDVFNGIFHTITDTFYIEPAQPFGNYTESPLREDRQYIVYRDKDVVWENSVPCSTDRNFFETKSTRINPFYCPTDFPPNYEKEDSTKKYSRVKRSANTPTSCSLKIVIDHLFFQYIGESDVTKTLAEVSIVVRETDAMFRSTDINGDGTSDNLGVVITDVTIYTDANIPGYKMAKVNMDHLEYLETFSEYDFREFCLAVSFTYRDFPDGVVGLAWVASSSWSSYPGGICQHPVFTSGKFHSFNTGVVTSVNHGIRIPRSKTIFTFAHELGHSFGSPHDMKGDPACAPGGKLGNFIMYPYSYEGDKPNNRKFSPCSIGYINPVVTNKGYCLIDHPGPVCGNAIIEKGEECDCGPSTSCQVVDYCCTPSDHPPASVDTPCSIRRENGFTCSPQASQCCDQTCQITAALSNHACQRETDCTMESKCDGTAPSCPLPDEKPNGTRCLDGQRFCFSGRCQTSLCVSYGLLDCMCSDEDQLCNVCCVSSSNACVHFSRFNISLNNTENILSLPGQPCHDYQGYCTADGMCMLLDSDSTIERLSEIFGPDSAEAVRQWFAANWFYVILGVLVLGLLLVMFWVNYKLYVNPHILAKRTGKLLLLLNEATRQKQLIAERMGRLDGLEIDRSSSMKMPQTERVKAVSRLVLLFPTVPVHEANRVAQHVTDEEVAVRYLLLQGYPMMKIGSVSRASSECQAT